MVVISSLHQPVRQFSWRIESPLPECEIGNYSVYSQTGVRTRRRHQKSRFGCLFCRKRRIKCSEDRPICSNCRCLRKECQYPAQYDTSEVVAKPPPRLPVVDSSLITSALQIHMWEALAAANKLNGDLIGFSPSVRSHALESLDHFTKCDRPWLKNPTIQNIMQRKSVSQLFGSPYMLHTVLGISAAHLAVLCPETRSYGTASMVHWQMFMRSYNQTLHGDLESENVDALFFASHIHSMLASVHERHQGPRGMWAIPQWILSLRGVKSLWDLPNIITRLRGGVWQSWIQSCEQAYRIVLDDSTNAAIETPGKVLVELRKYCNSLSPEVELVHNDRIKFLTITERHAHSPEGGNCLSWFITRAPHEYIMMMQKADEVSLLLLLYWCQLAMKSGQWWLAQAASHESDRLYEYLSQTCSNDTLVALLNRIVSML